MRINLRNSKSYAEIVLKAHESVVENIEEERTGSARTEESRSGGPIFDEDLANDTQVESEATVPDSPIRIEDNPNHGLLHGRIADDDHLQYGGINIDEMSIGGTLTISTGTSSASLWQTGQPIYYTGTVEGVDTATEGTAIDGGLTVDGVEFQSVLDRVDELEDKLSKYEDMISMYKDIVNRYLNSTNFQRGIRNGSR